MLLVVGLGNPGSEYARHRHNVGFMVVDELAARLDCPGFRSKFSGEMTRAQIRDTEAVLLKPMTYMNLSGDSVQPCAAFFKVAPAEVVVIHDEVDLPFGDLRLKRGGGHAGHNGLRSIIQRMGADFARVRFGIGRPAPEFRGEMADWVLSPFSAEERANLAKHVELAAKSVLDIATRGFEAAMKTRNTRPKRAPTPLPKPPTPEGRGEGDEGRVQEPDERGSS
jgi:PTH1 family peptidyl-tRNA hydrolase